MDCNLKCDYCTQCLYCYYCRISFVDMWILFPNVKNKSFLCTNTSCIVSDFNLLLMRLCLFISRAYSHCSRHRVLPVCIYFMTSWLSVVIFPGLRHRVKTCHGPLLHRDGHYHCQTECVCCGGRLYSLKA